MNERRRRQAGAAAGHAATERVERELAGPPPVPSQSESEGYRQETAEELGAKPLPGMHPSVPTPANSAAPEAAPTP